MHLTLRHATLDMSCYIVILLYFISFYIRYYVMLYYVILDIMSCNLFELAANSCQIFIMLNL